MLVFWEARLVLLAVPKTGTTALEAALEARGALCVRGPPALKHMTPRRYLRHVEPLLRAAGGEGFETVAVVREPLSWLSSWYRYRARAALDGHPNGTRGVGFDGFVAEWLRDEPAPYARVGSQAGYVLGEGGPGVTHAFPYEAPEALRAFLAGRLGPLPAFERRNVSPVVEARLSPALAERVRRERPREFEAHARALRRGA